MTTGLGGVLSREAESGLTRLTGTRLSARIVARESALVEALRQHASLPDALVLHVQDANRLALSYGPVRAGATLAATVDVLQPRLVLTLDSTLIGWALRLLLRHPAVRIDGPQVSLDLEQLSAFAMYRRAWAHVRSVVLSTTDGAVQVQVEIAVN